MSIETFIDKYKKQFKAMSPDYDQVFALSKDEPIRFADKDNLKLAFACIADTHLIDKDSATVNLDNFFKDIASAEKKFEAVLIAGDLAEYGKRKEYNRFFNVFDKYKNDYKLFVTMGNHDVRFQYGRNQKIIMDKANEYLNLNNNGKSYYSYDINGYTFIVIGTEKRVLEKAHITQEQIDFLDNELKRATKDNKPAFVMCHQAFANTHGLPEVWKTGDMGEQSHLVRAVMEKYKNVIFINGHLHGGLFEKTFEVLNESNGVYSISIPCYRKENNFGFTDCGVGYYCEVYEDKVLFIPRKFVEGKSVDVEYGKYEIKLK
ncbi:MAG: metallophosphoesterase [Clostridia bacterium]|nr:metallophosphoesterase [Clostridia bacterium]